MNQDATHYKKLQKVIGIEIKNDSLLKLAFIHKSDVNEQKGHK